MTNSDRIEKLQAGRQAALAGGKSPRQVGAEKAAKALRWVYRWGWSTPTVLDQVGQSNRTGLTARLVKQGLLLRTRSESGGYARDVPAYLVTLTETGLLAVERDLEDPAHLMPYARDAYRVNQALLRHDLIAQAATAKALAKGDIAGFITERELRRKNTAGEKLPDVIWRHADGSKTAVEVELSAKWSRDLDGFVQACIQGMTGDKPMFDRVAIVSDSPAILKRYKSAFRPKSTLGIWERDKSRKWHRTSETKVPEWIEGRMLWHSFTRV